MADIPRRLVRGVWLWRVDAWRGVRPCVRTRVLCCMCMRMHMDEPAIEVDPATLQLDPAAHGAHSL